MQHMAMDCTGGICGVCAEDDVPEPTELSKDAKFSTTLALDLLNGVHPHHPIPMAPDS